ncbi:MAG: hypothetical protein AVDCRST_MAG18-3425 [uncultured Thermomicrobiales bacterium]|uniref:Uncharacterized protein n=1 Tax=uncultured Thermomicrobiales bacterium TaxID=1645740 RepID=A0A6J4VMD3_9BACT|nr:MAG: hypothetical protein AVDCRST_MAG18-3425 [uncultured Thermomicrobiales bacterium]
MNMWQGVNRKIAVRYLPLGVTRFPMIGELGRELSRGGAGGASTTIQMQEMSHARLHTLGSTTPLPPPLGNR